MAEIQTNKETTSTNQIEIRTITELLGYNFYIPDYQRGYRWTHQNVVQLLEDIWEYAQEGKDYTFYCLQPVVVRNKQWQDQSGETIEGYEVIDGQQRLTTIHRLLSYLRREHLRIEKLSEDYDNDLYTIDYKTRPESKAFLQTDEYDDSKPDLYYMSEAYETIKNWFTNEANGIKRQGKNQFLDCLLPDLNNENNKQPKHSVQVIWYEIKDADQKSEQLFTRLNRGKIPLTSAELIKAKFVNSDSFKKLEEDEKIKRRTQLIQLWDEIENQLNKPKFWAFISNAPLSKYSSKIEYLFDIATEKSESETDPLYSFIRFFDKNNKETADSLWYKWIQIEKIYRALQYWYNDKNFYHKIGFLIAQGNKVKDLAKIKSEHTKDVFEHHIDVLIAEKIHENWEDLSYAKKGDREAIVNTLLLTNIEMIRTNDNKNDLFPFQQYKAISKSLEHIHAQNIETVDSRNQKQWQDWLKAHVDILPTVATDKTQVSDILSEVEENMESLNYQKFEELSSKILALLPKEEQVEEHDFLHRIENLALLGSAVNSSLSNSVFEVKRRKIINLDRRGAFIPIATRRIFLHYYSEEDAINKKIWSSKARKNYLDKIRACLAPYLQIKTNNNEV